LSQQNGYDHRDALFGIPPYGGSIQEKVYYTKDNLCGRDVDTTDGYPQETNSDGSKKAWQPPFILMVDRGDCTFVQKVRNAQRAGAAAVLIADSTCICGMPDCTMEETQVTCEVEEPIMADDGSGLDISIPSFLVFKQDADRIKEVLLQNQPVRVEMSFSMPAPDSRVEYDLWTTPKDVVSKGFLKSFKEAAVALGKDAFFTPYMFIYDGERAGCRGVDGENECFNLCTNAGRYCATDPDDDLGSGISGADIVKESLRRICVWQIYGTDGIGRQWWEYIKEFGVRCDDDSDPTRTQFFTKEECVQDAMTHAGIDKKKVDKCMEDTGGLEGDVANTAFDAQLRNKETSGAFLIPSLYVNQAPVRGEFEYSTIFKAICAGYAKGSEPTVCQTCANCHDEEACVRDGRCSSSGGGGGVSTPVFVGSLLGITAFFSMLGYVVYRRQQQHMRDQVRGILAEYMPIDA
jgi:hypothetical protein